MLTAPPEYLQPLFDGSAGTYDSHMLNSLGYRPPQLMRSLLDAALAALSISPKYTAAAWTMFDAGVGTGLCGIHMQSLFKTMVRPLCLPRPLVLPSPVVRSAPPPSLCVTPRVLCLHPPCRFPMRLVASHCGCHTRRHSCGLCACGCRALHACMPSATRSLAGGGGPVTGDAGEGQSAQHLRKPVARRPL